MKEKAPMKKIICFGDSNTYGYDPASYTGRYDQDIRWTGRLMNAGYEVVNFGMNGRKIPEKGEFGIILNSVRREEPADLLIVMIGTNDILQGSSAVKAAEKTDAFLRCLRDHAEPDVLLVSPVPMVKGTWTDSSSVIRESDHLADEYRKAAEDLGLSFCDAGEWNVSLAFDGVHFTAEGHQTFAENIMKAL